MLIQGKLFTDEKVNSEIAKLTSQFKHHQIRNTIFDSLHVAILKLFAVKLKPLLKELLEILESQDCFEAEAEEAPATLNCTFTERDKSLSRSNSKCLLLGHCSDSKRSS